jgi:hypothetical protein
LVDGSSELEHSVCFKKEKKKRKKKEEEIIGPLIQDKTDIYF